MSEVADLTRRTILGTAVAAMASSSVAGATTASFADSAKAKPSPLAYVVISNGQPQFSDPQTFSVGCVAQWQYGELRGSAAVSVYIPVALGFAQANALLVEGTLDRLFQDDPLFTPPRERVAVRLFGGFVDLGNH